MAVYLNTTDPQRLLTAFKNGIDRGQIVTWSKDSDGDFTHTPDQWINKAWLRPRIENGRLALYIVGRQNAAMPLEVYAVYHGRFIEAMIRHCRSLFDLGIATPYPTSSETVTIAA